MKFVSKTAPFSVTLSQQVVEWIADHCQKSARDSEAGGQLFGRIEGHHWHIEACTGPRPSDRRSANRYTPDTKAENIEILDLHEQGYDFLGDWHTHYENFPKPSGTDISSTRKCWKGAKTELPAFVLLIAGARFADQPCYVGLINAKKRVDLMHEQL